MQIKANGRSAVIMTAGLLAIWVSPVHACDTTGCERIVLAQASEAEAAPAAADAEQPVTRSKTRHKRHSSRKTDKAKAGSASKKEAGLSGTEKPADAATSPESGKSANKDGVTPAVANANAQMMAPAAPGTSAQSFSDKGPATAGSAATDAPPAGDQAAMAPPTTTADADNQVVAPDELNELDRAAADKPAPKVLRPTAASVQASVGSEDTWNQTSLIGKIFIAVGGLLTLASAARMFIA